MLLRASLRLARVDYDSAERDLHALIESPAPEGHAARITRDALAEGYEMIVASRGTPNWGFMTVTSGSKFSPVAGLFGGVAHFLFGAAFRAAAAATLAPFNYTQMLWAGVGGWLVFGELPTPRLLGGAAIIVNVRST